MILASRRTHSSLFRIKMIMAIRWRRDGRLICATLSKAEEGDTYIDERLVTQLVDMNVLIADENHAELNNENEHPPECIQIATRWMIKHSYPEDAIAKIVGGNGLWHWNSQFTNKGEDNEKI